MLSPAYVPKNEDKKILEKWSTTLGHPELPPIRQTSDKVQAAKLLENQLKHINYTKDKLIDGYKNNGILTEAVHSNVSSNFANYETKVLSMVRRSMKLTISGLVGNQAMSTPVGLIYSYKAHYGNNSGPEALFGEADTAFSGASSDGTRGSSAPIASDTESDPFAAAYTTGTGMSTAEGEKDIDAEMTIEIGKTLVEAKTRKLKSTITEEANEDLESQHQMNLTDEMTDLLHNELVVSQNRQVIRTIYITGKKGGDNLTTPGVFDMSIDADSGDFGLIGKIKALRFQIDREANQIYRDILMGRGNKILASMDVISALDAAQYLDTPMDLNKKTGLDTNWEGDTFAGKMGHYDVYVDPYAPIGSSLVVGYRGNHPFDAGIFMCPYIPFKMQTATDSTSLQPIIGFRTRYGIAMNPFVVKDDGTPVGQELVAGSCQYYRKIEVKNLGNV